MSALESIEAFVGLSPAAKSLIGAAVSIGKDDGPGFIAHIKAHDWGAVALDVVKGELELAAAVPSPIQPAAALALELLPVGLALTKYAAANGHNSGEGGIGRRPEGEGLSFSGA